MKTIIILEFLPSEFQHITSSERNSHASWLKLTLTPKPDNFQPWKGYEQFLFIYLNRQLVHLAPYNIQKPLYTMRREKPEIFASFSSSSKCCISWNLQICAAAWIWALGTVLYNSISQLEIHKFSKFTTSVRSFHQNTQFSLPNVFPQLSFIAFTARKTTFLCNRLNKGFYILLSVNIPTLNVTVNHLNLWPQTVCRWRLFLDGCLQNYWHFVRDFWYKNGSKNTAL